MSAQLPGESDEEYVARLIREAPPLSDDAQIEIRAAADEYWEMEDERELSRRERRKRRRDRRKGDRRRFSLRVAVERRKGERRINERREM